MENFLVAAAAVVGGAVVQEVVSKGFSVVLGKRKEKASQGQYLERLLKAIKEVEFVLERTAKMPITEVSLLRDRFELKRDFIQATTLLDRRRKRQAPQDQQEIPQAVLTGSSSSQPLVTRPAMFFVSSLIGTAKDGELCLSCDDVDRFEQFADSARNILRRVESSCSLRRYMFFPCSLVRRIFDERETLIYRMVQADQRHYFVVCPARLEEGRGVEVVVAYRYSDHRWPDKSFFLGLVVRLSESTDIVGILNNCLQSLKSQFNHVADTAMGELTLLASNLHEVSYSDDASWVGVQEWHSECTQMFRPDPLCCKSKGQGACGKNDTLSELSHIVPEEVIFFTFSCYISAPEYSLRSSSARGEGKRSILRNRRPPLQIKVILAPHNYVHHDGQLQPSYAVERIGANYEGETIDVSIQQVGDMAGSRAINCFLRQPKLTEYMIRWVDRHGAAWFFVEKPTTGHLKTRGSKS